MISINNLNFAYPNKTVLQNINLTIPNGQIIGLLGVNGVGKSTLIKLISRQLLSKSGNIIIDDINMKDYSKLVTVISEEGSFFNELSVLDNGYMLKGILPSFDFEKYVHLINYFQLPTSTAVKKLSRGDKSKVEMALGFAKSSKYILLDEPFLGADIFARKDFLKLMISKLIQDETIIITTHQVDEIQPFLDRAVFVKDGSIAKDIMISDIENDGITLVNLMHDIYSQ